MTIPDENISDSDNGYPATAVNKAQGLSDLTFKDKLLQQHY